MSKPLEPLTKEEFYEAVLQILPAVVIKHALSPATRPNDRAGFNNLAIIDTAVQLIVDLRTQVSKMRGPNVQS